MQNNSFDITLKGLQKVGKIRGEVRIFKLEDEIWQILNNDFKNEISTAKELFLQVEFNSNVNLSFMKGSESLVESFDTLTVESLVNEEIPNNSVKCSILFAGI